MAAKKKAKAKRKTPRRRFAPFDYIVDVESGLVIINGVNGGNIYGKAGQVVTFTSGAHVSQFSFDATDFRRNDSRKTLTKKWPFRGPEPTWPRPSFSGVLKSPGLLAKKAFYKYSIKVTGAVSADPVIIIDR